MQEWFESWFDTPYYHLLYAHRNDEEAQHFIRKLVKQIHLHPGAKVLDNACGRGRHARYLAALGYQVTGLDLSANSIAYAKTYESTNLKFDVHDMRKVYQTETFDAVFNLFTSFGYFDDDRQDAAIVAAIYHELKQGGCFVLDFLNATMVTEMIEKQRSQTITINGIVFDTNKRIQNNQVIKEIQVTDANKKYAFEERVRLWTKDELVLLLESAGFKMEHVFGSYSLEAYSESGTRCILVARKN